MNLKCIKLNFGFEDRNSNELLYIANYKALDCLLGNRCFLVSNLNFERH